MSQNVQTHVLTGNFVKLTAGDAQFLVPQEDVVKTGYLQTELVPEPTVEGLLCPSEAMQKIQTSGPITEQITEQKNAQITEQVTEQNQLLSDDDFLNAEIDDSLHALSLTPPKPSAPVTLPESSYYVALSSQLELMSHCPKNRFLLTTLAGIGWQWCWDNVEVLLDLNMHMTPIPDRLACEYTPVLGLVMMKGKPVFQTSAERILAYVSWQMAL